MVLGEKSEWCIKGEVMAHGKDSGGAPGDLKICGIYFPALFGRTFERKIRNMGWGRASNLHEWGLGRKIAHWVGDREVDRDDKEGCLTESDWATNGRQHGKGESKMSGGDRDGSIWNSSFWRGKERGGKKRLQQEKEEGDLGAEGELKTPHKTEVTWKRVGKEQTTGKVGAIELVSTGKKRQR